MPGKAVAFLNFKGGVGNTTLVANLGHALNLINQSVLLLDLDPQFNLSQLLINADNRKLLEQKGKTAVRLFRYTHDTRLPASAADYDAPAPNNIVHNLKRGERNKPLLDIVCGSFDLTYTLINRRPDDRLVGRRMFEEFIAFTRDHYDFVLIDLNPGISPITNEVMRLCDHIVVPVRPDRYSYTGLKLVHSYMKDMEPAKTAKHTVCLTVLNGMPLEVTNSVSQIERNVRGVFGDSVLTTTIPFSDALAAKHNTVGSVFDRSDFLYADVKVRLQEAASEIKARCEI